ncbi:ABC transporter ATP-binding protein [Anaeromyxobacter sp. Red801]|uniref:ABC transporter ATP-binding protein n=1 Tax=Anaeromyxobacter sp. Red801 TaxID=3411632 RepID=UPI003BA29C45
MSDALRIEGLGKTYRLGFRMRKVVALDALDLRVAEGSVFGFVGPNGAGKSTTIKILVGLVTPSRGRATIFGRPISHPSSRHVVGYLPENPSFHEFLRPLEVLTLMGRLSGMGGRELRARAQEVLELVGLDRAADLTVRKFSKGMVQRLGLAQAILHDPPLLILDEPMSGLDPIGRAEVRDLIVQLGRRGKTIFFSTHILGDVESICDHAGMLLHGELVRQGSLGELLDGSIQSVELRCVGLAEAEFDGLRRAALNAVRGPDCWVLSFRDVDAANAAAARVVSCGGRITALLPHRETLEQSFVRLARAQDSAVPARAQRVG